MSEDVRVTAAKWMFAHDQHFKSIPPMGAFDVYAKAVLCCANADGHLAPGERDWVLGYFASLGAPAGFIEELRNYPAQDDVLALIANVPAVDGARRSLVFDAIRASSADGVFHEKERAAVERVAEKLDISKEDVRALELAYADEVRATSHRIKLMYPQGAPF